MLEKICNFSKFSWKISDMFFQGRTLFGHIDWCETKRKSIVWILGIICDLDLWLTHDLYLGCFKVKFRNSCVSGIDGVLNVKWEGNKLIGYWADCMTLPFHHTHDLDLGVSTSEFEIALSQEWDSRLTWNEEDASHPFMTIILTSEIMVVWADVLDNDQGDFRHQHAVDISSCFR